MNSTSASRPAASASMLTLVDSKVDTTKKVTNDSSTTLAQANPSQTTGQSTGHTASAKATPWSSSDFAKRAANNNWGAPTATRPSLG
ncbi:hypothetical protein FA15DRAFT_666143 [Coprinopsis marcescibilis]|uniref:Uncharacterized protein n=1 Tax=Coprinopsis marcescibilis TaxID=230819 RepID=A0A5C3L4R9_COPMA|nr:hypothetical protein FA15DRAFT_666143 [Coprinopsis marcescibilis]